GLGAADPVHPSRWRRAGRLRAAPPARERRLRAATRGSLLGPQPGLDERLQLLPLLHRLGVRTARLAYLVRGEHVADEPAQRRVRLQGVLDDLVLGVLTDVAEQFDGQLQLIPVDGVGAVADVVGQAGQYVDVVVGDVDLQRTVGGRGADVVVGRQIRQVVVVLVGQVAGQRPFGAEHADAAVAAEEHRGLV